MEKNYCDSCLQEIAEYDDEVNVTSAGEIEMDLCPTCIPKAEQFLKSILHPTAAQEMEKNEQE